jgi:transmembrane sensor
MSSRSDLIDAARWALNDDDGAAKPPPRAADIQATLDDPALAEALERSATLGRLSDGDIRAMRARRRSGAMLGLALLVSVAGIGGWFAIAPAPIVARYETARGEQRDVRLADGSTLHLNGATRVDVRLEGDRRFAKLERGEAFFDVAHDAGRPFAVRAGSSEIRVLGTAFDVEMGRGEVKLAVYRGKVRFGGAGSEARGVDVPAGWRSRFGDGAAASPRRFDATREDWRQGWLDTDDMRLTELIDALNRRDGPMIMDPPPAIANLKLSGRLRTDNPRALLTAMGQAYGFRLVAEGERLRIVAAAE